MRRPSPLLGVLFVMCLAFAVRVRAESPATAPATADSTADVAASAHAPWVFEKGMHLRLLLHDGSHVDGDVLDVATMAAPQYRARYTAWRDTSALGARLPHIGDTLRVVRRGRTFDRLFAGFGPGGVYVREHPGDKPRLIEYAQLETLGVPGGEPVAASELAFEESVNALPSPRVVVMVAGQDTTSVLVDDIERIESGKPHRSMRTLVGALVGLTIFGVIVYAMVQGCHSQTHDTQCEGYNPTFYGPAAALPSAAPPRG